MVGRTRAPTRDFGRRCRRATCRAAEPACYAPEMLGPDGGDVAVLRRSAAGRGSSSYACIVLLSLARALASRRLLVAVLLVSVLAACASGGAASFDPSGPCTTDGQREGAYPDLESALPASFDGAAPQSRDSGRNCTETALGTLAAHGIDELHFAGALWPTGR